MSFVGMDLCSLEASGGSMTEDLEPQLELAVQVVLEVQEELLALAEQEEREALAVLAVLETELRVSYVPCELVSSLVSSFDIPSSPPCASYVAPVGMPFEFAVATS